MLDVELDWNDPQQLRETLVRFYRRARIFGEYGKAFRGYPDNAKAVENTKECQRSVELYAEMIDKVLARIEELESTPSAA